MARHKKRGIEYFSLDCNFFSNRKIKILKSRYGADGITIFIYLLCEIYKNGYYIIVDDDFYYIVSDDLNMNSDKVKQVLTFLLERSMFDKQLFQSDAVLTSAGIQERFQLAVKTRAKKNPIKVDRFWLLNEEETEPFIKVTHFEDNSENNTDNSKKNNDNSREESIKESKVKESNNTYISTPTLGEIQDYVRKKGSRIDTVKFFNYYQMRNWCINGSFISDWEAAVDYWDSNEKSPAQSKDRAPGGKKAKNQFNAFDSRDVTNSEMQALEKMLLEK